MPEAPASRFQQFRRWLWIAVVLVCLYTGFVMGSRWWENREAANQALQQEAEANREIVEQYGDGALKILAFYASPGVLQRGTKGLLCYGVSNADGVQIEPAVEHVGPAISHCAEVQPQRSTTYTLTATGKDGKTETRQAEVTVR